MCIVMPLRIGGFKPPFCLLALQSNMIIHVQYMCWVCFSADNECLLQAVLSVSQWRWYATIGLTWRCCVTPCHLVTLNACVRVTIVSQVLWEKSVYIGSRTPRILSTQVGKPTRSSSTQHIIEFQSLSYLLHCQHPGALGSSKRPGWIILMCTSNLGALRRMRPCDINVLWLSHGFPSHCLWRKPSATPKAISAQLYRNLYLLITYISVILCVCS